MTARTDVWGELVSPMWRPGMSRGLTPAEAEALLDRFAAEVRADALREAADKLALELAPEQPGAGPGFLLALRLAMRAIRRMADEAATQ